MAAEIAIAIRKSFSGGTTITADLLLPMDPPSVTILFGPSGSGKTTILRCLAGLEQPEQGTIVFNGRCWLDTVNGIAVQPQDRALGYMSQDYALFPNHTVEGNVAYGLTTLSGVEKAARVNEVLRLLQIEDVSRRRPAELSGGQQQRAALARPIARRRQLLLLDEPLSALDAPTRTALCSELRVLLGRLAIPSIVVTHDWTEALALGDQIAVIDGGHILQTGTPQDVFSRPANADVARVVGVETVLQGTIVDTHDDLATVQVAGVSLTAVSTSDFGPSVFICIRAEDVTLESGEGGATSARNHLVGRVSSIVSVGALAKVAVDCGIPLTALVTRSALAELKLETGSAVKAAIKAGAVHLVPRTGLP
jgi:molybdate transport system ATP-binding protein